MTIADMTVLAFAMYLFACLFKLCYGKAANLSVCCLNLVFVWLCGAYLHHVCLLCRCECLWRS